MRQAEINPTTGRAWVRGTHRTVGSWSFSDETYLRHDDTFDRTVVGAVRLVWHYSTLMGVFLADSAATPIFRWEPNSIGWGSVSDQQGCNKIVQGMGGWYYSRKGGAKWVQR